MTNDERDRLITENGRIADALTERVGAMETALAAIVHRLDALEANTGLSQTFADDLATIRAEITEVRDGLGAKGDNFASAQDVHDLQNAVRDLVNKPAEVVGVDFSAGDYTVATPSYPNGLVSFIVENYMTADYRRYLDERAKLDADAPKS